MNKPPFPLSGPPYPNEPSLPVPQRIKVHIVYLDGTEEEVEANEALQLGIPGLLMIPQPRGVFVGIPMTAMKRWEAVPSGLAVISGTN